MPQIITHRRRFPQLLEQGFVERELQLKSVALILWLWRKLELVVLSLLPSLHQHWQNRCWTWTSSCPFSSPGKILAFRVSHYGQDQRTCCHPHTGLKLSKNPTSSNKLGYNHNPGGTTNMVIPNRINLNIAMTKNSPISPSRPILK